MILGVAALVLANAAVLLGARFLLDRVRTGRPALDALLFLLLRLLLISAVVIVAGLTRGLRPVVLGAAGAAALGFLLVRGAHRPLPRRISFPWNRWLTVLAALLALRLLLQVWFFAPYFGDVLAYHLPKVAEWVRAGRFTLEMGSDPRATFPAGFELLEIWWTVFLHHDVLIETAGVEFLGLAAVSAYALAREFGWGASCAMVAAISVSLIPGLHLQATSCMNDGAVAALVAATAALVAARVHPGLLLIPLGIGIGVKPTFAYAVPGLALFALMSRRDPATFPRRRGVPILLGGAALLVGSFWYLRNLVAFGNPIHPMGSGGMLSVTGIPIQSFGPSFYSLVDNMRSLIDLRIYDDRAAPSAAHTSISNWGPASFAIGFPAAVYLARSEPRLRRLLVSLLLSWLCVWSLVIFDLHSARFVLFVPVAAALAMARLVERHRFALPIAGIALALQVLSTCLPAELDRATMSRLMATPWRERTASPHPPGPAPAGYLSDYAGTPYWLYGPSYSTPVIYLRDSSIEGLLETLRRERIRSFTVGTLGRATGRMISDAVARGQLRRNGDRYEPVTR